MGTSWKQVWEDIRRSLGRPAQEPGSSTIAPADGPDASGAEGLERRAAGPQAVAERLAASAAAGDAGAGARQGPRRWAWVLAISLAGAAALYVWSREKEPTPPSPDVVATFDGGRITVEDVRQHLAFLVPDESMRERIRSPEDYRHLVYEMIGDELIQRWAADRKADQDEDFQHVMKHLDEEMNLDKLADRFHGGDMGVAEADVLAYYEANRERYSERSFDEVRAEIRETLKAEGGYEFEQDYLAQLKANAVITRDFALLDVPAPAETELEAYYRTNAEAYRVPATALVDEIRIPAGSSPEEELAREKAGRALARLRSDGSFEEAAAEAAEGLRPVIGVTVRQGDRGTAYDEAVFRLEPGQLSDVFRAADAYYVVRLGSVQPQRRQTLDEVRDLVRQAVLDRKEEAWFRDHADRTLLTIDGRRFTVGRFWEEYQELPFSFRARYPDGEGRRQLAEQLIGRWLVIQDSKAQPQASGEAEERRHRRLEVLTQMMEQEEVDDKLEVTDEEVRAFFEEHKDELVEPGSSRVRYIVLRLGQTEGDRKQARDRADQVYQKLAPGLLRKGEDFVAVAKEYSDDPVRAEKPGWLREGANLLAELTQHPLHQYVESLRVGEIGEPFEWGGALYLFDVLERTDPRPLSFEEAEPIVHEEVEARKHQELGLQLNEKLLGGANVTIYDSALQALAEGRGSDRTP